MAGTLFDSKIIKNEIKEKYSIIIELYQKEVMAVDEMFERTSKEFKRMGFKVKRHLNFFFSVVGHTKCLCNCRLVVVQHKF